MPRISREAVTRREALARILFKEGKTPEEVQARMMEVDVGGGRKGLKMDSARLAELARAHAPDKGKRLPDSDTDVSLTPDKERVYENARGNLDARATYAGEDTGMPEEVEVDLEEGSLLFPPTKEKLEREESMSAPDTGPGSVIRTHQCKTGIAYTDLEVPSLTGVYTEQHGGLYCFQMEDGRVFKLYNNDKVREKVREAV